MASTIPPGPQTQVVYQTQSADANVSGESIDGQYQQNGYQQVVYMQPQYPGTVPPHNYVYYPQQVPQAVTAVPSGPSSGASM